MDTADRMVGGRCGRFGPRTARLVAAAMLVLLVLGATMDAAGASQTGRSLPQRTFVKNCQNSGGTVSVGAEDNKGAAVCTWRNADGTVTEVACEFTGAYLWHCTGQTRLTSGQGSTKHGELGGSVVADGTLTTVRRAQAVTVGVVLVLDDEEQG
jgi:hypothetical protein